MKRSLVAIATLTCLLAACDAQPPSAEHETEEGEHEAHEALPRHTTIKAETARLAGIRVAPAVAGVIADEHQVQGLLAPVEGRVAQVAARFPGPVRSVRVNIGDRVNEGQLLATIESNLSLSTYDITAPIAGVVMVRNASIGMMATEGTSLFEIADLSTLWVDLHVFGADAQHIRPGVPVTVTRLSDGTTSKTTLERVLPGTATASQSTIARAPLANADGLWRPGSAVTARITVGSQPVALAVPTAALQTAEDQDVVYVQEGDTYHTRPVKLGQRDSTQVEILEGLKAGELVVVDQSFLVKADIEKSAVEEEH